jgi:hypothetical protein
MNQAAERVESVKAGSIAAIATTLIFVILAVFRSALFGNALGLNWAIAWQTALAGFSGFLFGVTYRYIIRQDQNSHLKSGAILAFGLVRGLAEIEALVTDELLKSERLWQIGLAIDCGLDVLQSVVIFAVGAIALNWSLQNQWLRPFS